MSSNRAYGARASSLLVGGMILPTVGEAVKTTQ
jgi:hypothetical protein